MKSLSGHCVHLSKCDFFFLLYDKQPKKKNLQESKE